MNRSTSVKIATALIGVFFMLFLVLLYSGKEQLLAEEYPLAKVKMSTTKTSVNIFDNTECQHKMMLYGYKDKDDQRPSINADKGSLTLLASDDTTPHSMKDLITFELAGYNRLTANVVGWGDNVGGTSELVFYRDGDPTPMYQFQISDYLISGTKCITVDVSGWETMSVDAISPSHVPRLIVGIINPILYK